MNPQPLLPEVADKIDRYVSAKVDAAVWPAIEEEVKATTVKSAPATMESAGFTMTVLSQFADMVHELGELRPGVRLASLIDFMRVRRFVDTRLDKASIPTVANYVRILRVVGRDQNPGGWPPRHTVPRPDRKAPHSGSEMASFVYAAQYVKAPWGPRINRAIGLSAGGGAAPEDLRVLLGRHVVRDGNRVLATFAGLELRTVEIDPEWAAHVWKHRPGPDEYWMTGTTKKPYNGMNSEIADRIDGQAAARLNVGRLRTACLVRWIEQDLPVDVFNYRAGLTSMHTVSELLEFVDRDPADWQPPGTPAAATAQATPMLRAAGGAA